MRDLYRFHDAVYKTKLEPIHWDLGPCVGITNGDPLYPESSTGDVSTLELDGNIVVAPVADEIAGPKNASQRWVNTRTKMPLLLLGREWTTTVLHVYGSGKP